MCRIVFKFFILIIAGIGGTIIQKPLNVATHVGGNTFFNCTSNRSSTNAIMWIYSTEENTNVGRIVLTEGACDVQSSLAANFKTEKLGEGNVCNLIIFNAAISHGGFYSCDDYSNLEGTAQSILIVVGSSSTFDYNVTDEILSGENLYISKTVSYGGPSINPPILAPLFYWTLESDTTRNISSSSSQTTNRSSSDIVVTAQQPAIPIYVCNLFFDSLSYYPPACARNVPSYKDSWSTESFIVSNPVENVSTSNECHGDDLLLTCYASGYPSPNYTWTNLTNSMVISNTNQVNISKGENDLYRCTATNQIRDVTYTKYEDVNASICTNMDIVIIPPPQSLETWEIVSIACGVAYVLLNLVAMTVFLYCCESDQEKLKKRYGWFRKMIPCNNEDSEFWWIFLFFFASVTVGIFFFPILLCTVNCSCCKEDQKMNSREESLNLEERNGNRARNESQKNSSQKPTPPTPPPPILLSKNTPVVPYDRDPTKQTYLQSNSAQIPDDLTSPPAVSLDGIIYQEMRIDSKPGSRKPVQLITGQEGTYAELNRA